MTSWCSVGPRLALLLLGLLALAPPALADSKSRRGGAKSSRGGKRAAAKAPAPPPPAAPAPERKVVEEAPRPAGKAPAPAQKGEEERDLKRGERVEFDGRLIEGQTAASGAIYLFERLPSELRSMVTERRSYRREVLETLYPSGVAPTPERGEPRPDKGGR